eukprot:TRINITY_DN13323_c0_g1_i1.p1 TRINITY_DN13323_c0_g1~~TRINITY_DN13323_c0_g1_i1.p1  ORF type:complete len:165 (-),score=28.66 TRINITY_DN13323_c0_g1_i1:214-708(-)
MAHFSQDPLFLKELWSDGDLFLSMGSKIFNKPESHVTPDEREKCKRVTYGILYGIGSVSLSQVLHVTVEEAKKMLRAFKETYTGVMGFIKSIIASCEQKGYVTTISGRKTYFPEINSPVPVKKKAANRQAVNTVCQGSASDLVKLAMINIHQRLQKNSIPEVES